MQLTCFALDNPEKRSLKEERHVEYSKRKSLVVAASLAALLTVAGCHKKNPAPPPPPAPPETAPAPMATITANPSTITPGGSSMLTWKTTDATNVSIVGLGQVASSGTQTVQPTQTTSYHLIAQGDGGNGRRYGDGDGGDRRSAAGSHHGVGHRRERL